MENGDTHLAPGGQRSMEETAEGIANAERPLRSDYIYDYEDDDGGDDDV